MSDILLRAAAATVRLWTHVYTHGLPPAMRDRRREEIESDLWQAAHASCERSGPPPAVHMLVRLFLGIPDDLGWRMEQQMHPQPNIRTLLAAGIAAVVGLAGAWGLWRVSPPALPAAPDARVAVSYPPPPPPPPPPALPPSIGPGDAAPIPLVYGHASYTIASSGPAPARIKEVAAVYPPILAMNGVEGEVVVRGTITDSGRVADVQVVQPQGYFTQPAIDAIQQWEFEPPARTDQRGPRLLTVTVRFSPPDRSARQPVRQ